MCACCAYQRSAKRESSLIILSLFSHDDWRFFNNEETFLHSFSSKYSARFKKKRRKTAFLEFERKKKTTKKIMGKQVSGAQKRKKKK